MPYGFDVGVASSSVSGVGVVSSVDSGEGVSSDGGVSSIGASSVGSGVGVGPPARYRSKSWLRMSRNGTSIAPNSPSQTPSTPRARRWEGERSGVGVDVSPSAASLVGSSSSKKVARPRFS